MNDLKKYNTVFNTVVSAIRKAKQNAIHQVNTVLIDLYWEIGKTISQKVQQEKWGKSVVQELALHIKKSDPTSRGFSDKNLWRMKQFYETYHQNKKLASLAREIPWTHNTIIFSSCKTTEEQAFYIQSCIDNKYTIKALERQITTATYQRSLQPVKLSPLVRELHPKANQVFKDNYTLEFLGLPALKNKLQEIVENIIDDERNF